MKKLFTLILFAASIQAFGQGPVIEGTYLPVRGTAVKEVWNKNSGQVTVPHYGQNTSWDYSTEAAYFTDTFLIKTFDPDSTLNRYHQYFPTATHASYLRTPFNNISDSLYSYYLIDTAGLHMLGGFNTKNPAGSTYIGYDTTAIINPSELFVPNSAAYGMIKHDTSRYVTYGVVSNFPIKIKGTKMKTLSGEGYGQLTMPDGSIFNDVLLTKIVVTTVDSGFFLNDTYTGSTQIDHYIEYSFLRNNTFGSSSLMYFKVDSTNSTVVMGWYTLPVDFGYITGRVYDSLNQYVTHGQAYLYRENSNFAKNDILDKSDLDAMGSYRFDSIPFGQYRVAIRADSTIYPTAFTTYYGDTTDWLAATVIYTTDSISSGNDIYLRYHPDSVGQGHIHGSLNLDGTIRSNQPIPGIDVVVKKKPSGHALQETKTDSNGEFDLPYLGDGDYDLFVDIPGLHMSGTYNFTISGATAINCLDFTSGTDSIHPTCQLLKVQQYEKSNLSNTVQVYPNPYSSNTTIKVNMIEKGNLLLEVYNILGERVQILEKGTKQKGFYSYEFSAKNLNYPAGIYFVRLTTDNIASSIKIIEQ
jgi:hypothetical protein